MSFLSTARIITLLACFSYANQASSDSLSPQQQTDILKPINMLFDGMREGSGEKVRAAFHEQAIMHRAHSKFRKGSSPEEFARAVAQAKEDIWDEKIWDINIQLDDNLASVWTQFAFYLGDELSHCGVNSFQLYRFEAGWQIVHLVDTYRDGKIKGNCNVPDELKKSH